MSDADPVKRFASLQIQRDPTSGWVLAFSILAMLGLFAGLFVPRRRLWVKAHPAAEGVRVEYAGLARGEDSALARAVADLASQHTTAYVDEAGTAPGPGR
ncbi:cytochrome c biogenesis protein ResB [Microbacterium aurantiacum]|uniref:cytochrome c biogenesis protein ResB n=1 Tax=Microbacterium aurantiacum TaxID=162393 RepID=UPI004035CC77